jgi:site-specific recombinase XerC
MYARRLPGCLLPEQLRIRLLVGVRRSDLRRVSRPDPRRGPRVGGERHRAKLHQVNQWLPHTESRVRARTHRRYRQLLEIHVIPALGNIRLSKLRPAHVQSMLDGMTVSARTRVHVYRVTSAALRQAVRWQLVLSNVAAAASPPRPDRPSLTVPDAKDVNRLIDGAGEGWLHVAVVLAASTGLRRDEVLGLQWRAVNLDSGEAEVAIAMENVGREIRFNSAEDRSGSSEGLPPTFNCGRSTARPGRPT